MRASARGIQLDLSVPERSYADSADPVGARARFYGSGDWDERVTRQCYVPWQVPFIDKDGRVFACCFAASADERQLGQIGPETFDEIWSGHAFRAFRRDIVDGVTTPEICRRCTVAPLGVHPFKTWAAAVVSGHASVTGRTTAAVSISARNLGERPWTRADQVRIGTAGARDSISALAHPGWLSPNRPATFSQHEVPPGAVATFEFAVAANRDAADAEFEIVADGSCWIPNTSFSVRTTREAGRRRRDRSRPDLVQSDTT